VANDSFIDRFVKDLAAVLAEEVRAQLIPGSKRKVILTGRGIKRDMRCRVKGCKNRSKGPRFGYICEEHLKKLSKAQQRKARANWNEKHA